MRGFKILSVIASFCMIVIVSPAQEIKELAFEETIHEFGVVNEVDGPVDHEFLFTNTGSEPIKVLNVRASCGCTTPGWTKEEIPAGGTGFIKARYNTTNRPGPFNKSLTVTTSGTTSTYVLYIKGRVNPKPRTIEDDFPTVLGGLRVKNRAFTLNKALSNKPVTRTFEVYNASEETISFLDSTLAPEYIDISVDPLTLEPEQKSTISVTYDVVAKNTLGSMRENVVLFTDEEEDNRKNFTVYINIEEYFPPMTPEELAAAPRLIFDEPLHDFGRINQGDVVTTEFTFRNDGKKELNIRKTESSCGCTIPEIGTMTLQPGEESTITVKFNSNGRRGQQQKSVTIFSNDPKAPTQRIIVKAYIETGQAN